MDKTLLVDNPFSKANIADIYIKHCIAYHNYATSSEEFARLVPFVSRILEVGVGVGTFTELLLSFGYDVKGIDLSPEMLKRASERVQGLTQLCNLLDYNPSEKFDVVVSHSGGFTYKRGKFETYFQIMENLDSALQKVHGILDNRGRFFINKGEHEGDIDFGDGATLTIRQEDQSYFRIFTYTYLKGNHKITEDQRRIALSPDELQEFSSQHFNWNFDHEYWIVGEKK
ncbi:MAG: class I SAM-dependent methyltransferase [Candidatus Woesearchaeota archaeon]